MKQKDLNITNLKNIQKIIDTQKFHQLGHLVLVDVVVDMKVHMKIILIKDHWIEEKVIKSIEKYYKGYDLKY